MKELKDFINEKLNWVMRGRTRYDRMDTENLTEMVLNIKKVFRAVGSDFSLDVDSVDGGKNAIGNRMDRAIKHFEDGGEMDLPVLGYNEWTKSFSFSDGRHRTLAAYKLGQKKIPFLIMKEHFNEYKKLR